MQKKKKKRTENRRVRQNKWVFLQGDFLQRDNLFLVTVFFFHFLIFSSISLDTDTHWRRSFHCILFFLCWWQCDTKEIDFFFRPVTFHSISRTHTLMRDERSERRSSPVFTHSLTILHDSQLNQQGGKKEKSRSRFVRLVFIWNEGESTTTRKRQTIKKIYSSSSSSTENTLSIQVCPRWSDNAGLTYQ